MLLLTKTGAGGEAWECLPIVQAHIPVGNTGETVCADVWLKVLGAILFRTQEFLSQGSTKNKTGSGVFVVVPRSGKGSQRLLGVGEDTRLHFLAVEESGKMKNVFVPCSQKNSLVTLMI